MRRALPCLLLACTATVRADWLPHWLEPWQHPEPMRGATPVAIERTPDGGAFALVATSHHGANHATLVRFDANGGFAWLREHEATSHVAMVLFDGRARAAIVDGAAIRTYDVDDGTPGWSDALGGASVEAGTRRLAVSVDGDLFLRANADGDVIVARWAPDGTRRMDWRWTSDVAEMRAVDIAAMPDGGAVVAATGAAIGGGVHVVRFGADGEVLWHDREDGDLGNPLGATHVVAAGDGSVIAAASPESSHGAPEAVVWKVHADGTRAWTTVLPQEHPFVSLEVAGLVLRDGDVFAAPQSPIGERLRLLRLDVASGEVDGDAHAGISGYPSSLAVAPNGRLLVAGFHFVDSSGHTDARIAEFDPAGSPCRATILAGSGGAPTVAGDDDGWLVLVASSWRPGEGNDALLARYDADGDCDRPDALFADGFDA